MFTVIMSVLVYHDKVDNGALAMSMCFDLMAILFIGAIIKT